jgi:hypothetical protein
MYHLSHQFCRNFYDLIEEHQGERNMTTPLHSRDINVKGDKICKSTHTQVAHVTQETMNDVEL